MTFLALLLLMPTVARTQSATTGQISGRVLTVTRQPLGQAWIAATSLGTGVVRGTLTHADGTFTILLLPPGLYDVGATLIGYRPSRIMAVRVAAATSVTAHFHLQVGALEIDSIPVVAAAFTTRMPNASAASIVTREEIENLPTLGRRFTDFIALNGLVSPSPETTTGGHFAIGGQRASQTNVQIDGADANNSFFAESRGGSRIPFNFSLESIREFQVIANGYDVEYGRYLGGVVNVITRGGTNQFQGTVFGNLRNEALTGSYFTPLVVQGDTIRRPRDYEVVQYGARVSGPVLRDRLHYVASVDGQRRREPFTPLSPDRFEERGDTAGAHAMNRFLTILQNKYGIANAASGYRPFLTTNDVIGVFGRLDYALQPAHRLSLRHNFAAFSNDHEPAPQTISGGLSATETIENVTNSLVGELQSVVAANTSNVLRFQYSSEGRPRTAAEQRPELLVVTPSGDLRYGGHHVGFQNRLDERKLQLVDNFTHQFGRHTFKVGVSALATQIHNRFVGMQGAGVFRFNSLDDFEGYRPVLYARRQRSGGELPRYKVTVNAWAAYAQHEWRITPRFTSTFGLRYDLDSFADEPQRIDDIERSFGARTGSAPADRDNVSPRLSLSYDVAGDGRKVVRAGAGYFYGTVPYVLAGAVALTERPVLSLICQGSAADDAPDAPPSPRDYAQWIGGADNPASCASTAALVGIPEYNLWSADFEFPETLKANLGWEQRILRNTRLVLDLVYSRGTNLYTVHNLNLNDAQFQLRNEAGRRVFTPAQFFNPLSATQTRHRRYAGFSNVLVSANRGMSEATQMIAELAHQLGLQSTLRASYTYSRASDNSSFNCCAPFEGYANARIGAFGPNEIGARGDADRAWGESDFNRRHVLVTSGHTRLPRGLRFAAVWRIQSGTPWTPEQAGDPNGDGINFNDRPFIFAPEDLPLDPGLSIEQQQAHSDRYARYLSEYACVREYVGRIVPRNTCRNPVFNRLDVSLGYTARTLRQQSAEVVLELFNLLNLLNGEWGRYHGVTAARRVLLEPRSFVANATDPADGTINYRVSDAFGERRELGTNLMLQWQAQLSVRYRF